LSDFASFVNRLVGTTGKVSRATQYGERWATWLAGADAVFGALTEFLLSALIFLTIAGVIVAIGG
jgi:hypothetical protein